MDQLFRKVSLAHEEWVLSAFGQNIPISAIKTGLLGSFIMVVALLSYFVGSMNQQQTVNWFAYYSDQGLCHVLQTNSSFLVTCAPKPLITTANMSNLSIPGAFRG